MDSIPLSWAQDVLKFSLKATASSASFDAAPRQPDLTNPKDPGKDPRFRKLVEAILFSRRFVPTYNGVLLGILLIFTAWHWGEKLAISWRRRARPVNRQSLDKANAEDADEAWSSSSSTIEGTSTPPDAAKSLDTANETSPLLCNHPERRAPGLGKPLYLLRSWLEYQPPPVPIVNKTLPPNSTSLAVIAFFALNIFYNFYRMPMQIQYVFVFADRCGIIFSTNLPLLYLLAAKNQPIKFLTGYSYESLNIFHRRAGELLCFEALLHLLGMFFVWYGLLRRLGLTLAGFIFNRVVGLGIGAFVAYEVLYFTSLGSFRQRCYEVFLATHVLLQVAGLALLWFHHHTSRPYVAVSLAIFAIDRLLFRLWLKSSSHPAMLSVLEDGETVLLSSNWDITQKSSLLPSSMANGWKPNHHIFLTVPSLSRKHNLQAHPFTIFSAAPGPDVATSGDEQHAWFTLLIRAQADSGFTRILLEHARTKSNIRVRLDGPYGSSHALDILEDSDTAIVIAGGSGIAVAYPLLWALLHPSSDIEVGRQQPERTRRVRLLWITHSASHKSWIPEDKLTELQNWGLELLIPSPTSEAGRPDVRKVVKGWISNDRTGVVVSGPDGLVRDVRNTCASLIANGDDIRVQVEKFGW